jgi:hypothetical protein
MIKGFQVIVGIKGGESDHFAATAGHAIHPFNGGSINAPQGLVQNDTSKNFNPRYGLHDQSRAVGDTGDMVLEYQSAHATAKG